MLGNKINLKLNIKLNNKKKNRFEREYKLGKIVGALRLPVNKMTKEKCHEILGKPEDISEDRPIIMFSKYGYVSVLAVGVLEHYGYKNLMNIKDGFFAMEELDFKQIEYESFSFISSKNNSNY